MSLKFWHQGMAGTGRRVPRLCSGGFCSRFSCRCRLFCLSHSAASTRCDEVGRNAGSAMHGAGCQRGFIPTGGREGRARAMVQPRWLMGCSKFGGSGGGAVL